MLFSWKSRHRAQKQSDVIQASLPLLAIAGGFERRARQEGWKFLNLEPRPITDDFRLQTVNHGHDPRYGNRCTVSITKRLMGESIFEKRETSPPQMNPRWHLKDFRDQEDQFFTSILRAILHVSVGYRRRDKRF